MDNPQVNSGGLIVEEIISKCSLICLNDGPPTRRNSNSVIDLHVDDNSENQYFDIWKVSKKHF